jgi:hypothetical protein
MANEATLYIQTGVPVPYSASGATAIEKGAFVVLSDLRVVASHSAINQVCAGIAATEKIANVGSAVDVHTQGYFRATASGSISVGDPLGLAATPFLNYVYSLKLVAGLSGSICVGTAEETAATGETFIMKLNPQNYWA